MSAVDVDAVILRVTPAFSPAARILSPEFSTTAVMPGLDSVVKENFMKMQNRPEMVGAQPVRSEVQRPPAKQIQIVMRLNLSGACIHYRNADYPAVILSYQNIIRFNGLRSPLRFSEA